LRSISSTVELDAAPERVWSVLTDTAAYGAWNPFITQLDGTLQVGNKIHVRIALPGRRPMTFHPVLTDVDAGRKLAWLGRLFIPGLFDGAHSFTLEPLGDGRTRLVQSEEFSGVLVRFSGGVLDSTVAGFNAMHEALRKRLTQHDSA
jgi:hypothetical protein